MEKTIKMIRTTLLTSAALIFIGLANAFAHCDSYDGPVIKDAFKAIHIGKVEPVLKWIGEEYEAEISNLFDKTIALKGKDEQIYQIVEKHFLETLVRLHREGEGAPYTGLKPAGTTSRIVTMTDQALTDENVEQLAEKVSDHLKNEIIKKFNRALETKRDKDANVAKGREFVEAYVDYTHYVEAVHDLIAGNVQHNH